MMVLGRKARNHIHYLLDDQGHKVDSQEGIVDLCLSYYTNLLGSSPPPLRQEQLDRVSLLIKKKCGHALKQLLSSPISDHAIKETIFNLRRNKTPWPNGFIAEFF